LASDPEVYIYGERGKDEPIVFAVRWEPETEEWENTWFVDATEDKAFVDKARQTIDSIGCAVVNLK
jgi:hypothetical protein